MRHSTVSTSPQCIILTRLINTFSAAMSSLGLLYKNFDHLQTDISTVHSLNEASRLNSSSLRCCTPSVKLLGANHACSAASTAGH